MSIWYRERLCSKSLLTCSQVRCFSCDAARKKHVKRHSDWKLHGSNTHGWRDQNNYLSPYYPLQGTEEKHWAKIDFCLCKLQRRQAGYASSERQLSFTYSFLVLPWGCSTCNFFLKPFARMHKTCTSLHLSIRVTAKREDLVRMWKEARNLFVSKFESRADTCEPFIQQSSTFERNKKLQV